MGSNTAKRLACGMAMVAATLAFAAGVAILAPHGTAHAAVTAGSLQEAADGNLQATSVTKASAFEYKVGRWVVGGRVETGKFWTGTKKFETSSSHETESHRRSYGCEFEVGGSSSSKFHNAASSWASFGYDCGPGVYITDYKGPKNAKVVVPDKIKGKPVVYILLSGVKLKSLDVSKCKHLKALRIDQGDEDTYANIGSLVFGKCPSLKNVYLNALKCKKLVNIRPKNVVSLTIGVMDSLGTDFRGGFSFDSTKLQYLNICGYSVTLGGLPKLKELNLQFSGAGTKINFASMKDLREINMLACDLKKMDISKNKKLKAISAAEHNFSKSTIKALKKWRKAKKGRSLVLD